MNTLWRYRDWPIRWKVGLLLLGTSLLPLTATAFIEYRNQREAIVTGATALLAARGDQVVEQLDDFHRTYQQSASRLSRLPELVRYSSASPVERDKLISSVRALLEIWQASDPNFRGLAILDPNGTVTVGTEKSLENRDLRFHNFVQEALRGSQVISDLHFSGPEVGSIPTIAYLSPVKTSGGKLLAVLAMWVRASGMWKILESANEKAGPGSFSVLFDRFGVRIGHSYSKDIVLHPGGALDSATVDTMVGERRFGEKTREILLDVKSFPGNGTF